MKEKKMIQIYNKNGCLMDEVPYTIERNSPVTDYILDFGPLQSANYIALERKYRGTPFMENEDILFQNGRVYVNSDCEEFKTLIEDLTNYPLINEEIEFEECSKWLLEAVSNEDNNTHHDLWMELEDSLEDIFPLDTESVYNDETKEWFFSEVATNEAFQTGLIRYEEENSHGEYEPTGFYMPEKYRKDWLIAGLAYYAAAKK